MYMTFVLALLAAMGLFSIAFWLWRAAKFPEQEKDFVWVVHLCHDAAHTEQMVKCCLRQRRESAIRGKLVFVDGGLSPEAQNITQLLLRKEEDVFLCSESQLYEILKWEREELGSGTD